MLEKIKLKLAKKLHQILQEKIKNREPDFTVGESYLKRWWIIPRNPFFNIYYHNFRVSDDDRALHDHMYINMSFLLDGEYIEHTLKGKYHRKAGDIVMRLPATLHRIELTENNKNCWTLFITGPRVRKWGFQIGPVVKKWGIFKTKKNWMYHETYIQTYGPQLNH